MVLVRFQTNSGAVCLQWECDPTYIRPNCWENCAFLYSRYAVHYGMSVCTLFTSRSFAEMFLHMDFDKQIHSKTYVANEWGKYYHMTYVAAFWFVSPTHQLIQTSKQCGGKQIKRPQGKKPQKIRIQKKHHMKRDQSKISSQGGKPNIKIWPQLLSGSVWQDRLHLKNRLW